MHLHLVIIAVMSYDIWFYFFHRLLHQPFLYAYHKKHHGNVHPTWADTFTADRLENSVSGIGVFAPYLYTQDCMQEVFIAFVLCMARGVMHHDIRFAGITGTHHLIHHQKFKHNYGEPWIDYLMGTTYKPLVS